MPARDRDVRRRRVEPDGGGAEARERFGQQAAAAADIERAEPFERSRLAPVAAELPAGLVADVLQAERVQPVERPHRPVRIPPLAGEPVEARDLVRVYG